MKEIIKQQIKYLCIPVLYLRYTIFSLCTIICPAH